MRKILFTIISGFCVITSSLGQNVSNIDFYLQDDKIIVTYDLDSPADIYLFVKFGTGKWNDFIPKKEGIETPALRAVQGDVGRRVNKGSNTIIWDYSNELAGYYGKISKDFEFTEFFGGAKRSTDIISSLKFKVEACPSTCEPEMVYVYFNEGWGNYWISRYETTIEEFSFFVKETGYKTSAEKYGQSFVWNPTSQDYELKSGVNWRCDERGIERPKSDWSQYPVAYVSYEDALAYSKWLSNKYNKQYSLPTECEWLECATELPPGFGCLLFEERAQWSNIRPKFKFAGSDDLDDISWYKDNSGNHIHPIGKKLPSEKNIYDACGNVAEITLDYVNPNASSYSTMKSSTPFPNVEKLHYVYGGNFITGEEENISLLVWHTRDTDHQCGVGFRCIMKIDHNKGQSWKNWKK